MLIYIQKYTNLKGYRAYNCHLYFNNVLLKGEMENKPQQPIIKIKSNCAAYEVFENTNDRSTWVSKINL